MVNQWGKPPRQKMLVFEDLGRYAPLLDKLAAMDGADGEPMNRSAQLRRAVREYLERRGMLERAEEE